MPIVTRTLRNHLRLTKQQYKLLRELTATAGTLFNKTLEEIYKGTTNYNQLYHLLKNTEEYKKLPSQPAQQVIKKAVESYKAYKNNPNKNKKKPKTKEGRLSPIIFPKDQFKVIDSKKRKYVRLSLGKYWKKKGFQFLTFPLPKLLYHYKLKEVVLVPKYYGLWFELHYIYEKEVEENKGEQLMGIDLGIKNFCAVVSTTGTAFLLEGNGIKSFNRWWNKRKTILQSIYDKQGVKKGKKMVWLLRKRRNVLDNFIKQNVAWIVKEAIKEGVGTIVVGWNKGIKQKMEMSKKSNQNFQYIPFKQFIEQLKSKGAEYGIEVRVVNESNTSITCSRCSFKDKKNRKYRGLFVCRNCGAVLNADINGAINILKKVASESSLIERIGGSGLVNRPVRIRPVSF
jgi:IS605 OrfB family transposase